MVVQWLIDRCDVTHGLDIHFVTLFQGFLLHQGINHFYVSNVLQLNLVKA
jgi:hypothetical protein